MKSVSDYGKRLGSPPTKELDDIIVQQTQNLSFPWTFGQGDRTSFQQKQRFVFDPDLLFLETSPEWKKIYAQMIRLNTEYWSEFHKTIREVEGPNRPLVRVAKSNDVGGNYEKSEVRAKDVYEATGLIMLTICLPNYYRQPKISSERPHFKDWKSMPNNSSSRCFQSPGEAPNLTRRIP
jgi:hypothetical protein